MLHINSINFLLSYSNMNNRWVCSVTAVVANQFVFRQVISQTYQTIFAFGYSCFENLRVIYLNFDAENLLQNPKFGKVIFLFYFYQ